MNFKTINDISPAAKQKNLDKLVSYRTKFSKPSSSILGTKLMDL